MVGWKGTPVGRFQPVEIRLRGQVLPVEGITDRVLASIKTVMLPARNARDPDDVPAEAKAKLNFVWLETEDYELAVVNNEVAEDA
jgi:ATP-dependent Lon protease